MHLVEQLRSKRSDAQKHLLSRKRKLAELYSVTAYAGDFADAATKQLYYQQLQAFQDANDLDKGRLFDESTLPPRPKITRVTRSTASQHSKQAVLQPPVDSRRSKSPAKTTASLSPRPPDRNRSRQSSPLPKHAPQSGTQTVKDDEKVAARDEGNDQNVERDVNVAKEQQLDHINDKRSPVSSVTAQQEKSPPSTPQDELQASSSRQNLPSKPPTINPDVPSSSSSNEQDSSHTPGVEAGSPDTSHGDEDSASLGLLASQSKGHIIPTRLPTTPDLEKSHERHKFSISSIDIDMIDADPTAAFDSPAPQSTSQTTESQETSRKPAIRVDTQQATKQGTETQLSGVLVETPVMMTGNGTPRPMLPSTPGAESARRATRIQSGALQKKSVSEILGEAPKTTLSHLESPTSAARLAERERKEKERSKLSTVVFAKPARPSNETDTIEISRADEGSNEVSNPQEKDYMYTLFESKAYSQNRQGSLPYLLQHAHKALSTADHLIDYQYQAHCRVLKRLYQLQNLDRWALRQRKRAEEPSRPTSHWDFLLDHAKWMRTDFREERRWKLVASRALAESCAEWVAASVEERKLLQVKTRPLKPTDDTNRNTDTVMEDISTQAVSSPPELEPTGEDDSVSEDIADPRDLAMPVAPAAIFSLGAADFTFATERTPAFDKLLNELPLYEPLKVEPDMAKSNLAEKLDSRWKTDIVPVSRFATEKLKVKEYKPPLKRSRYDYEVEDSPPSKRVALPPREKDVALFMPENKHIRDRIHPGHSFRPPAEHPMPTQSFFENRLSSQWIASDDDEVKKQAREFSFNWLLISELLTPPTLYVSQQDRRTPWECFERWIGLEGMPADMSKTPYFKTYSSRIEAAGRHVQAQWEESQRRQPQNASPSMRKRTAQPVRVERRRNQRHLAMLDAMRKLAKKREAVRQKAAHSADMAAMRKSNDFHQPRPGMKTPSELSQLKFDREQKMAKQQEMYKQQLIAHQRAVVQQQRGQGGSANGIPVPSQPGGPVRMAGPNGVPMPGVPNGHVPMPGSQQRPNPNMLGVHQGMGMPAGMAGHKNMPQGQMQGIPRTMAGSPQQIKMQQEQMIRQAQQAQQNGTHSSPNAAHVAMANGQGMTNAAYMAALAQQRNGQPSPTAAGVGNSTSPRPGSSHMGGQSLSSGSVPKINQLYASIKESHPNLSDEEVSKIATQQLFQWQQQATAAAAGQAGRPKVANQAALNAAMGAQNSAAFAAAQMAAAAAASGQASGPAGAPNKQGMMSYEQVQAYNQRMRMQQAQQHAARGMQPPGTSGMPGTGMNNSPVLNMARPTSQHSQQGMNISRSATPRDQRSGSASGINVGVGMNTQGQSQGQMNGVATGGGMNHTGSTQPQAQGQSPPQQQNSPRPTQAPMQT